MKNSPRLDLNQGPTVIYNPLQTVALPTELQEVIFSLFFYLFLFLFIIVVKDVNLDM